MYKHLKAYVSKSDFHAKMMQMMASKIVHETSHKLKIPAKDALCMLVMDDFWNDLKVKAGNSWTRVKEFASDNKHVIYGLLANLISAAVPAARPLIEATNTVFGGRVLS